jgi:hypothetical protein
VGRRTEVDVEWFERGVATEVVPAHTGFTDRKDYDDHDRGSTAEAAGGPEMG